MNSDDIGQANSGDIGQQCTSHEIYLLLKFIEIDEVSVNPLHSSNESGCQNLQKTQETTTLHPMFQFVLSWLTNTFSFSMSVRDDDFGKFA